MKEDKEQRKGKQWEREGGGGGGEGRGGGEWGRRRMGEEKRRRRRRGRGGGRGGEGGAHAYIPEVKDAARISSTVSAKPLSNIWSASSNTTHLIANEI